MRKISIALALAMSLLFVQTAMANLVTNGDFETGDFSGWTLIGQSNAFVMEVDSGVGIGGSNAAVMATIDGSAIGLSQTFNTTVGQTYTVTFYLSSTGNQSGDGGPISFQANWGGDTFLTVDTSTAFDYTQYTYTLTATAATTTLTFSFTQEPGVFLFDNVSADPVPIPGTLLLLASGLLPLGWRRLRKG